MSILKKIMCLTAFVAISLGTASCSIFTPKADPTKFYILESTPNTCCNFSALNSNFSQPFTLGVSRVRIPDYLDTSSIAYIKCPNQVVYSEYNRWAESLDTNIQRVLGQNIGYRIPCSNIVYSPWIRSYSRDLELHVRFNDFVIDRAKKAIVAKLTWELTSKNHQNIYFQRNECFEKNISFNFNYNSSIKLMDDILAEISDCIVADIKNVLEEKSEEIFCQQ